MQKESTQTDKKDIEVDQGIERGGERERKGESERRGVRERRGVGKRISRDSRVY